MTILHFGHEEYLARVSTEATGAPRMLKVWTTEKYRFVIVEASFAARWKVACGAQVLEPNSH